MALAHSDTMCLQVENSLRTQALLFMGLSGVIWQATPEHVYMNLYHLLVPSGIQDCSWTCAGVWLLHRVLSLMM